MARMTIEQAAEAVGKGTTFATLADVSRERLAQLEKWGVQHNNRGRWLSILVEEVGEVAKELNDTPADCYPNLDALRAELIQVAAVAVAWCEDIDAMRAGS